MFKILIQPDVGTSYLSKILLLYNSNFTNFLHSDWLFGRLYTSIKAMRKNTQFSP